ncbi:response regulator [bacterium]|nr:response regulator [bacterium]
MNGETKILLIEDNPDDVFYIREILSEEPRGGFHVEHSANLEDGIKRLSKGGIDVVLLDLGLPDSWGLETIAKLHPYARHLPVVVLSGLSDIQTDMEAIDEGVQDYIVKGHFDRNSLSRSILHAIQRMKMVERLRDIFSGETASLESDLEAVLNVVSPEIRRPLAIVQETLNDMGKHPSEPLGKIQAGRLRMAKHHIEILCQTFRVLEDLLRMEADVRRRVRRFWTDPVELVLDLCASLKPIMTRHQIALEADTPLYLPNIYVDAAKISQALVQLVMHALKFARRTIRIQVRMVGQPPAGTAVRFGVADDGPPIPPDRIETLFNPLSHLTWPERIRPNGGRLGLSVCRKIVEIHAGKIWAESTDRGNARQMVLPCVDDWENFRAAFSRALKIAEPRRRPLTLLVLSVGNLEMIKAHCESREIERMFRGIEERVASVLSADEMVCRVGGSIAVLCSGRPDEVRAIQLRILERMADCACAAREGRINVVRRIGSAVCGPDGGDPKTLFLHASLAQPGNKFSE